MLAGLDVPEETDSSTLAGQGAGNRVDEVKGRASVTRQTGPSRPEGLQMKLFAQGGRPALYPAA